MPYTAEILSIIKMELNEEKVKSLPENAYRELKPGEEYKPVLSPDKSFVETSKWSVGMGLLMAVVFSAAAAYSGLKIGQVFEAAIPISIIAVGASAAFKKKNSLAQNVIIQSIGSSSGVIVAGAVFTIPGLYILQAKYPEMQIDFWQIFFSSLLGGFLGILFMIPFRKYFVKDMHGKLPFPEATATTEILMTGEKGGSDAKLLITSGLIGGLFDFCFSSFRLWSEEITSRIVPAGAMLAEKFKMVFKFNVSALIFSFGYLVGLRFAVIITVGSLLSWLVLIPLVNEIGVLVAASSGGVNPFAAMSAEQIFADYVRPIGIGAIAMAGIIGIINSAGVIGDAFKLAVKKKDKSKNPVEEKRTQRDLKMTFVMLFLALTLIAVFVFLIIGVKVTLMQAIVALLTITVISFLFTTVAANAIAIVGSNPVSGMTLMTLILSSVILVSVGLSGWQGMVSGLIIGGIVCTALSMAGGFVTDLKIGYWIGTTPAKQQSYKFLGTLVSAATVGAVIFILNEAYGFVATPEHTNPMVAPQANAMAAIIEPLMSGGGAPWMLLSIGAVISVLLNWLKIPPLAFALGMFIPLPLNTPLIVGGLLNHWVNNKSTKDKELSNARNQRAILISSGFIAGAALFGVLGALIIFLTGKGDVLNLGVWADPSGVGAQVTAIVAFAALIGYFVWEVKRAKKDN